MEVMTMCRISQVCGPASLRRRSGEFRGRCSAVPSPGHGAGSCRLGAGVRRKGGVGQGPVQYPRPRRIPPQGCRGLPE